jgi:hypothetical protein
MKFGMQSKYMNDLETYEDFHKRMEEKYPKILSGAYGGIAIGRGWWLILDKLLATIQNYLDWKNRESEVVPQVVVEQIKEKFGGLRFYYQGGDSYISGLVDMTETWASVSCEECSGYGIRRSGGWIRTLCDKHEAEYQERKKNE